MVILSLGSNIDDRLGYLSAAVTRLRTVLGDLRCSRVLESRALLPPGAPAEWDRPYLNMAVSGHSALEPLALLNTIKTIERELGRKDGPVWSPRPIDIDILAMDDKVITSAELTLPHKELLNRDFMLLPLAELAPGWTCPLQGKYHKKPAAEIVAMQGMALHQGLRETRMQLHG